MKNDRILLSHGAGGRQTHNLISDLIVRCFSNSILDELDDSALLSAGPGGKIAFTTDSYVVKPIFFPGGDIGKLAICGTVNDLAVTGAVPKYISCGFIIEEGFPIEYLERILASMKSALDESGTAVVTGDTKVVEKGAADGIFINTAGVGLMRENINMGIKTIRQDDVFIVNGTMGDHGLAVMAERESFPFKTAAKSDCAPLNGLIGAMLAAAPEIRFMRDLTRGGLATVLNEIAAAANVGIEIDETAIPISISTAKFCEFLGLDPLYLANEGKLIAAVPADRAEAALEAAKSHPLGRNAAAIGTAVEKHPGKVAVRTRIGGARILDMLTGDPLPRIC
jgi:hydrogenase expression/formation protein HypE